MYFFGNKVGVSQVSGEMSEDILSGWTYYFIALIIAMVAGGFISRYSHEGAAGVSLLILWVFTVFWSTAPLIVTGVFILTTFHATVLATIAVLSAMMAMRSMV
jgi:hypothetical protein